YIRMPTLAYGIQELAVGQSERTGNTIRSTHVVFDEQPVDITADQALAAVNAKTAGGPARKQAKEFLMEMLADGRQRVTDLQEAAKGHSISWRVVETAKSDLAKRNINIRSYKEGGGKGAKYWWEIRKAPVFRLVPKDDQPNKEDSQNDDADKG